MYASKSFCGVDLFVNNAPSADSTIGEITADALTFSKEIGVYKSATLSGYTLYNLSSKDSVTGKVPMPSYLVEEGISLCNRVVTYVVGLNGQIFPDQLIAHIQPHAAALNLSNVVIGPIRQHGDEWIPDWIRWSSNNASAGPNENIIWFSLPALRTQYTEYEIVVVPPVDDLDAFFLSYSSVNNTINNISLADLSDRVQIARAGKPYTHLRTDIFQYINPVNSTQKVNCPWSVLIYGPAGNNIDSIKNALVDYILENSTRTVAQWTQIFPDIFKRTEFILAPHWNKYAIADREIQPGIYSPVVEYSDVVDLLYLTAPNYSQSHIQSNASVFGHSYNSLAISVVGSIDNRESLFKFKQVFPDYIDVGSTSLDFNRMSPTTQEFSSNLATMLTIAETMNEFTEVPIGFTKLIRDNIIYVVKSVNNIQYIVASKKSVIELTAE